MIVWFWFWFWFWFGFGLGLVVCAFLVSLDAKVVSFPRDCCGSGWVFLFVPVVVVTSCVDLRERAQRVVVHVRVWLSCFGSGRGQRGIWISLPYISVWIVQSPRFHHRRSSWSFVSRPCFRQHSEADDCVPRRGHPVAFFWVLYSAFRTMGSRLWLNERRNDLPFLLSLSPPVRLDGKTSDRRTPGPDTPLSEHAHGRHCD